MSISSCKLPPPAVGKKTNNTIEIIDSSATGNLTLTIEAKNLSEDMSIVSSNNDEIYLLLYQYNDSTGKPKPVYNKAMVFDSSHTKYIIPNIPILNTKDNLLLFLIEEDSDRNIHQLDSIVQRHYTSIIPLFEKHELVKLGNYIGDDDILGYIKIPVPNIGENRKYTIDGIVRADKYEYMIELKR